MVIRLGLSCVLFGFLCFNMIQVLSGAEIPNYIGCTDSNDCDKSYCCTIGMGRFTTPTCRRRLEKGDICIPQNVPKNTSVTYPDNFSIHLTNIYFNMCPCGYSLTCVERGDSTTCEDPSQNEFFNHLEYPAEYQ